MMKSATLTIITLAAMLTACGGKTASNESGSEDLAPKLGNMSGDMDNMAMPAAGKAARGSGTVTAIDKTAGTITLRHGPIPEANWPAMTMPFKARPSLLDSVNVGDTVSFDLAIEGDAGEVTAIRKQ
jgi:Cu(I)/Ag(I) efflux system periplasmic protein CusF